MAKLVTLMFDSLPHHPAVAETVVKAKLVCLRQTVNSQVFQDAESRALLLPTVCTHLKRHMVRFSNFFYLLETLCNIISLKSLIGFIFVNAYLTKMAVQQSTETHNISG